MILAQLVFFVLFVQAVIRPAMAAFLFTRPPRLRVSFRTPADWDAAYEDVEFTGAGGITLRGWYTPSQNGAAVVLLHGHSGNRLAVAYHAEALARAGFGVLMFDLRAHGSSGGRRFVRGVEAVDDVLAAVAFVSRRPDITKGVGIFGVSVGGMLAIQAAARNITIRAVAVDGSTVGTIDDLPPPANAFDRFWRYPLERYYQAAIEWFSRSKRPPANTVALSRLARRPILFISAGGGFERRMTQLLYNAAAHPKQLWEIPTATHANGWAAEPELYARTLVGFFDRGLSVNSLPDEPDSNGAEPLAADEQPFGEPPAPAAAPMPEAAILPIDERTVSPTSAMMMATVVIFLAMLLMIVPFQLRWGFFAPPAAGRWSVSGFLGLIALLMVGLLLHEAVHLAGYRIFGRVGPGVAGFQFGRAALAPQIRCAVPIRAADYRRILLLPALVLGILPGLVAFFTGSWPLLIWSVWMLVAAGGDFIGLWAIRGLPADTPVAAHPKRVGCLIYEPVKPVQNIDK